DALDEPAILLEPRAALFQLLDRAIVFVAHLRHRIRLPEQVRDLVDLRHDRRPELVQNHGVSFERYDDITAWPVPARRPPAPRRESAPDRRRRAPSAARRRYRRRARRRRPLSETRTSRGSCRTRRSTPAPPLRSS